MSDFVHLHIHSMGSLLDGFPTAEEIVERAVELGHESIAVTDHGSMGISLQFYEAAKAAGIKPLIGVEGYLTLDRSVKEKGTPIHHIGLIAATYRGFQNLSAISDIAWNEGFYNRPRFDFETLEKYSDDIIALSGCMDGIVSSYLREGDFDSAIKYNDQLKQIFKERYFIEIQPWNPDGLNRDLLEIADLSSVPYVVTADAHFCREEDLLAEEVSLLMNQQQEMKRREKEEVISQFKVSREKIHSPMERIDFLYPNRKLSFAKIRNYIMSRKNLELRMLSAGYDVPEAFDNTLRVAEMVESYDIPMNQDYLPKFIKGVDSYFYLQDLALDKLKERGLDNPTYRSRLKEELGVIKALNFSDYMLVIWDVCNWAKINGILTGPGRGSVGGSLLAYVLGITRVDPIKHGLLFWRFLNVDESGKTARVEPPDIDTDVEDIHRDRVKEYLVDRWKHVASISAVSKFSAKGMIRDLSRVFAVPLSEVNEVCKHFETLDEFFQSNRTMKFRTNYPEIADLARKFEGRWKFLGVHAAGMVVADRPIETILPVESRSAGKRGEDRIRVTAYDMDDVQKLGLIKFDMLGLSGLTVINDALRLIKQHHGEEIDLDSIDLNDKDVLDDFSNGNTVGVFQVDTQSYTKLLKDMRVDSFEDLMASNALVRPGPLLTVTPQFIARKHGDEEVPKEHPLMEEITKETYNLIIYQEQLMQALVSIGGFTKSEADKVRKIIGKKRDAKEFEPFKNKWVENAAPLIGKTRAAKLWKDFLKFAGYAFNKSHACEYSVLSYQTMWLKRYYPAEYMLALMRNETDSDKITRFIFEAKRLGLKVETPDINKSAVSFSVVNGDTILYGLSNVHLVGVAAAEEIIAHRPYKSKEQLEKSVNRRKCNQRAIDALVNVGAFKEILDTDIEYESYYYPLLGYAYSMDSDEDSEFKFVFLSERDQKSIMFIKAIAKNAVRKPGWARLEVSDTSATESFFLPSPTMEVDLGRTIIAGVTGNDLLGFTYYDDFMKKFHGDGDYNGFERFFLGEIFGEETKLYDYGIGKIGDEKALVMPIYIRKFKTTKGRNPGSLMAVIIVTDGDKHERIVIFPQAYASCATWLTPYEPIVMKTERLKDGDLTIPVNGVRLAKRLLKEKIMNE